MSSRKSKVTKFNRGVKINAGFIIFFFVFVYIIVFIVNYLFKEQISIYEVTTTQIADNNSFSGLIVRDEITVNTPNAGYITYYFSGGSLVGVKDGLFSINEGAQADQQIADSEELVIRDNDYINIRRQINNFSQNLDSVSYSNIYDFKANLNNIIFEVNSGATTTNMDKLLTQMEEKGINVIKSPSSALASNIIDNLTGLSESSFDENSFNTEKYTYSRHNTGDLLEKEAPAVRLITSDTWEIIIQLDDKQYEKIKDLSKVTILLNKYNIKTSVPIKTINKSGKQYGILTLNKYIANYVDDRFIDVELLINSASGLKIPNTAITSKDFYLVPMEYIESDGNGKNYGITKVEYDKNGEAMHQLTKVNVYFIDEDNNAYIDSNLFEPGTVIVPDSEDKSIKNKDNYTLSVTAPLKGVYIVNQGYFDFRRIEVIYDNEEYSIVKDDTKYGLNVYDQVVSDAKTAKDDAVIY